MAVNYDNRRIILAMDGSPYCPCAISGVRHTPLDQECRQALTCSNEVPVLQKIRAAEKDEAVIGGKCNCLALKAQANNRRVHIWEHSHLMSLYDEMLRPNVAGPRLSNLSLVHQHLVVVIVARSFGAKSRRRRRQILSAERKSYNRRGGDQHDAGGERFVLYLRGDCLLAPKPSKAVSSAKLKPKPAAEQKKNDEKPRKMKALKGKSGDDDEDVVRDDRAGKGKGKKRKGPSSESADSDSE
ncbi:hypothetical protein B0H14DRAFT_2563687 [Mycena olivaceomarginata]|nr:hypothetical protein B0H14DRAFT_2563687 [Mycena olivaceomarginata]